MIVIVNLEMEVIMALFRTIGKGVGMMAGSVIGGVVKRAGKAVNSGLLEGVGDGITKGTKKVFGTAGQFIDGAVKGTYGVISNNETIKSEGMDDLKGSTLDALKGLENSFSVTVKSLGAAYMKSNPSATKQSQKDPDKKGETGFVAVMSVGSINPFKSAVNNQVEEKPTPLDEVTKEMGGNSVPFIEKTIDLPIGEVTGTFPVFDVGYEVQLPVSLYLQTDIVHWAYANVELYNAIRSNPDLIHELGLDSKDIEQLLLGMTPDGYAWHHHEEAGKVQLVDKDYHQHNGHTGGRELWGGGFENR